MRGLSLKFRSPIVSSESVLSTKPTSGLKFVPVLRRSTNPSSQLERYANEAPTSLAPLGSPGECVPAMWALRVQSLKKTRRVSAPTVRLKLSRTSPDCLSVPMTPKYEPGHSDSFNRTIAKLACGLGPLERVPTSMPQASQQPSVTGQFPPPLTGH